MASLHLDVWKRQENEGKNRAGLDDAAVDKTSLREWMLRTTLQ